MRPPMSPERWKQIDGVLQAAMDLAPEELDAFLAACAGDQALEGEVRKLLIRMSGPRASYRGQR